MTVPLAGPGAPVSTRAGRPARFAGGTAGDVMITAPKTLPIDTTLECARRAFEDPHVHMLLLASHGVLHGTLLRADLPAGTPDGEQALPLATLEHRTARPGERIEAIGDRLAGSARRLAVVGPGNRLLGLLCLKRDRTGFCSDRGVAARARERAAGSRSQVR